MFQMRKRPIKSVYFFYKEHHLKVIFTGTRRLVRVIIAVLVEVAHLQEHNRTDSWLSTKKNLEQWNTFPVRNTRELLGRTRSWRCRWRWRWFLLQTAVGTASVSAMWINNKKSKLKNVRGPKIDICYAKIYFCTTWIRHHRWQCRSGRWHQQWRKL